MVSKHFFICRKKKYTQFLKYRFEEIIIDILKMHFDFLKVHRVNTTLQLNTGEKSKPYN